MRGVLEPLVCRLCDCCCCRCGGGGGVENSRKGLVSCVVIALTNIEGILCKVGLKTAGVPSRRIAAQRRGNSSVQLSPRGTIGLGTRRPWSWIETILSKLLPS